MWCCCSVMSEEGKRGKEQKISKEKYENTVAIIVVAINCTGCTRLFYHECTPTGHSVPVPDGVILILSEHLLPASCLRAEGNSERVW